MVERLADAIAPLVCTLPVEGVFDHMGLAQAARGLAQPGLAVLLDHDGEPPPADYWRIDYGRLLSRLGDWAQGDDVERILVRNPARLYGFA